MIIRSENLSLASLSLPSFPLIAKRAYSVDMTWLAMTAAATLNRANPQAGNTAAFHAKNVLSLAAKYKHQTSPER